MVSENPSGGFILEGFRKRSIEAHNLVHLKQEQENVVNCLSEHRDVFGGFAETFQLFAIAVTIKKFRDSQHPDIVLLVTCPLTSILQG